MKRLGLFLLFCFVCLAVVLMTSSHSGASASQTASAKAALPSANPVQAEKCRKVLNEAPISWKLSGSQGGYGTVVVGPSFYSAPFEDKKLFDATVRCVLSDGRANYAGIKYVEYLDSHTNKEVAKWSDVTGFSVDD